MLNLNKLGNYHPCRYFREHIYLRKIQRVKPIVLKMFSFSQIYFVKIVSRTIIIKYEV